MPTYFLDLDGTMYYGTKIAPAAKTLVKRLKETGQAFYFLTNNASRTPQENAEYMRSLGFEGIESRQFFNAAMACVSYVKKNYSGRRVMMVGESGLAYELQKQGFVLVKDYADFVMVGLNRFADYRLYSLALQNLLDGALLIGTNADRILLSEDGSKLGNGSVIAMFEYASQQVALVTGKPQTIFIEEALAYFNLSKQEVILVGDNLETDILCGVNAGIRTVFVLGGVHEIKDIERLKIVPDRTISSLTELL